MRQIGKTMIWLVLGAAFGAVLGRGYYANIDPPADNFPPQVLPNPNALDTYRQAFEKLPQKIDLKLTASPALPLKQRQEALAASAEGLHLARLAQMQTLVFPRPRDVMLPPDSPVANLRALARLYAGEGATRLELGDERRDEFVSGCHGHGPASPKRWGDGGSPGRFCLSGHRETRGLEAYPCLER